VAAWVSANGVSGRGLRRFFICVATACIGVVQPGRQHGLGVVAAAVVDDDGFPIVERLRQQAAQRARQEGALLEGGQQYADARPGVHRPAPAVPLALDGVLMMVAMEVRRCPFPGPA